MKDGFEQHDAMTRDDETIARLLRLAGEADPIPPEAEARVYAAVEKAWRTSAREPGRAQVYDTVYRQWSRAVLGSRLRRWAAPVAIAATVLLAISIAWQPEPPAPAPVAIGTVARVTGPAPGTYRVGDPVFRGNEITTGGGQGLSLLLSNRESVRLDEHTTLVVLADNRFELVAGRVYADTGDFVHRRNALVIETGIGSVTDVGTQFLVHADGMSLDVAVREGRVDVSGMGDEIVAVAGERLRVDSTGDTAIGSIDPYDEYWDWVASLAPVFELENRSLLDFLRWAARETGRELEFEDNELRMAAMRTDLHGSIEDFTPTEAVAAVMSTTSFRYRIEKDRIVVFRK